MNFDEWFNGLSAEQQLAFATEAGTTVGYIRTHLIRANKLPQVETLENMVAASHGVFTISTLGAWFYCKASARAAKRRIAAMGRDDQARAA